MKTIARSRVKLIKEIFNRATYAQVFSLENHFRGEACSAQYAKKELYHFDFARIKALEPGCFLVTIHDNKWFEINSPVNLPGM